MATMDHCPHCGRRIKDDDMSGCETDSGQRYCLVHLPRDAAPELFDALMEEQARTGIIDPYGA